MGQCIPRPDSMLPGSARSDAQTQTDHDVAPRPAPVPPPADDADDDWTLAGLGYPGPTG